MKPKKARDEKTTSGTVVGAKHRQRCNELTDAEREKLNDEFLKVYYHADRARQPATPLVRERECDVSPL